MHSGTRESEGGNTNNGGSNKTCNFCGIEVQAQCYKKNPKKAPEWWRNKNAKAKSESSRSEIFLTSLGYIEGDGGDKNDSVILTKNATLTIVNYSCTTLCKN